jgi:two-component system, NtrC family, nitrogen regulation sensor histidine kinase NtrY
MVYNNFRLQIVLRVLLLALTLGLFFYLDFAPMYTGTYFSLGVLALLQTVLLIRYIEKITRQLDRFLDTIRYDDFTETFSSKGQGKPFDRLHTKFNEVIRKFREIRAQKEADFQYFKTIVQHVGTGIITYKKDGEVHLINPAAKRLLNIPQIRNIAALAPTNTAFLEGLKALRSGEKVVLKIQHETGPVQATVNAIDINLRGEEYRLVAVQSIQRELEEKEMEAWHNLVRVLTHEIMNSVTPISSLAATAGDELTDYLRHPDPCYCVPKDELSDIERALQTIQRRSEGLVRFVTDFRNLTTISPPKIKRIEVKEMVQQICLLLKSVMAESSIGLEVDIQPENLQITGDQSLIEQVLINLVKNACQAISDQGTGKVWLLAYQEDNGRTAIEVADNGPGITPEAQEKIFIPFYTTKPTGSGIGLSLSRQIMRMHNGSISVQSELGEGTTFKLRF